jgi:beta-lactamase regulating signal transducer with metallopeptidase domain
MTSFTFGPSPALEWLAQTTCIAAALAVVVAGVCRLGRPSPAIRHALWLVVLLKLLAPPLVAWPWHLPEIHPGQAFRQVMGSEKDPSAGTPVEETSQADLLAAASESDPAVLEHSLGVPEQTAGWTAIDSTSLALFLWLAGAALTGAWQLFRVLRFRRLFARGKPAPAVITDQVRRLASALGVRPPVTLSVPGITSPFVWGGFRPRMLWPERLAERLSAESVQCVIAHELAHLRRRDHWVAWLRLAAGCIWWWNPIAWYVLSRLRHNAELACDAWVLWVLPEGRRAYAEALIEVTQQVSRTGTPAPALGMGGGPRLAFEQRLTMIMRDRVCCRVPLTRLVAIGCLALAALPTWSRGQVQPTDDPDSEKPKTFRFVTVLTDDQPAEGAAPAANAERERKLQLLEKQIREMLDEIRALRGGAGKEQQIKVLVTKPGVAASKGQVIHFEPKVSPATGVFRIEAAPAINLAQPKAIAVQIEPENPSAAPVSPMHKRTYSVSDLVIEQKDEMLTLIRTTYRLPKAKAEVLAAFIRDHVKATVVQARAEGDSLIVTTTPDAQKAIRALIDVLVNEKPAATEKKTGLQLNIETSEDHLFRVRPAPNQLGHTADAIYFESPVKVDGLQLLQKGKVLLAPKSSPENEPAPKPH